MSRVKNNSLGEGRNVAGNKSGSNWTLIFTGTGFFTGIGNPDFPGGNFRDVCSQGGGENMRQRFLEILGICESFAQVFVQKTWVQ